MTEEIQTAVPAVSPCARGRKISVTPQALANQFDLSGLFTGVAHACDAMVADPQRSVVTHRARKSGGGDQQRHAVLGLGSIGPLASKPVMEGKAVLFKKVRRHRCVRYRAR